MSEEEVVEHLNRIAAEVISQEDWLARTSPLDEDDYAFIGRFVQIYCIADLNARRVINACRLIFTGTDDDFAAGLNETDVLIHLQRSAVGWTKAPRIKEGLEKAAATLEMHRIHRHHFAHWVVRRLGVDAIVILTGNGPEGAKRVGRPNAANHATWGMMMLAGLKSETEKLQGHSEYLAHLASYLVKNYESLRKERLALSN